MINIEIFFLPATYWIVLIITGIVTGFVLKVGKRALLITLLLFAMFSLPQLVFRVNNSEEPDRLIGQVVYFTAFIGVVFLTRTILKGEDDIS